MAPGIDASTQLSLVPANKVEVFEGGPLVEKCRLNPLAGSTKRPVGRKSWWSKDTVAVVTGANKGIGFEIARQLAEHGLTVVLTARDQARGQAALESLKAQGLKSVVFHTLDTNSPESAKNLATWLKDEFGGIDILINNAGITGMSFSYEIAEGIVNTNYRGPKTVTKTLLPLFRASPEGARIVSVTSRLALYERLKSDSLKQKFKNESNYSEEMSDSLATKYLEDVKAGGDQAQGWVPNIPGSNAMYSESKMFLNVYASALAKSLSSSQPEGHQIFVANFCPGVTQTEMLQSAIDGGFEAPDDFPIKTVADGADTGVWLALLPKKELAEKSGKLFAERKEYPFGWENPPF